MAKWRNAAPSTHKCSVPGCNERKTYKIAKSMGRSPIYICPDCMEHIVADYARLFPEEFAVKFASAQVAELQAHVSELQAQLEEANAHPAQVSSEEENTPTTADELRSPSPTGDVQDGAEDEGQSTSSVTGEGADTVELTEESLKELKREELDKLLVERGLDPKDCANKGECVAALLALKGDDEMISSSTATRSPFSAGEGLGETA